MKTVLFLMLVFMNTIIFLAVYVSSLHSRSCYRFVMIICLVAEVLAALEETVVNDLAAAS